MKKFILIFGASSGISKFFLRNSKKIKKFNVILTSRSNRNLNSLKKEFGFDKSFHFFKVDASKEKDIFQLKKKIYKHKIRIIVNFCGDIGEGGKITNLSLSKWKNSIDNNLTSFFNISKFFIPLLLKEKKPIFINFSGGGGNCVKIKHNSSYSTVYAHMSKFSVLAKIGNRVKQGQIIGYVGSTGKSTGPHLHYEVIFNGKRINSQTLKLPSGKILKGKLREEFEIKKIKTEVLKSELILKRS